MRAARPHHPSMTSVLGGFGSAPCTSNRGFHVQGRPVSGPIGLREPSNTHHIDRWQLRARSRHPALTAPLGGRTLVMGTRERRIHAQAERIQLRCSSVQPPKDVHSVIWQDGELAPRTDTHA